MIPSNTKEFYIARFGKSMCPDIEPKLIVTTMRGSMVVNGFEVFNSQFDAIQSLRKILNPNDIVTVYKADINIEDIIRIGCLDLTCEYCTKKYTFVRDSHIQLEPSIWKYFQ